MATRNKGIAINMAYRLTMEINESHLLWAIWYQFKIEKIPYNKISRKKVEDFLKSQLQEFGTRNDTLMGSNEDEIENMPDDEYVKIENLLDKLFDKR